MFIYGKDDVSNINTTLAICIPAFEKSELIQRGLESIKSQRYNDYVVIVTDDSCSEAVFDVCANETDINIIYCKNEVRQGAAANTNMALRIAYDSGVKYVKILHQDDRFTSSDALTKMVNMAEANNLDAVFTANEEEYKDGIVVHDTDITGIEQLKKDAYTLFRGNLLGAPSILMYRVNGMFFDPQFSWLHDIDFYVRVMENAKWDYIHEPLVSIGHDGTQLTDYVMSNREMVAIETYRMYKKYKQLHTRENRRYLIKMVRDHYIHVKMQKVKRFLHVGM